MLSNVGFLNLTKIPIKRLGLFKNTRNEIINEVNTLTSDIDKILTFHKITKNNKPFIIVNKKTSVATLYKKQRVIKTYPVGVGKTVGDDLNTVDYDFFTKTFGTTGTTTPSGQYTTASLPTNCLNASSYKNGHNMNVVALDGIQHPIGYNLRTILGLHQIPNEEMQFRMELFNQTGRRGMSTGCINFRPNDFEVLAHSIPKKTSVYVLPEEAGNKLDLVIFPDSSLRFRTNYANKDINQQLDNIINKGE